MHDFDDSGASVRQSSKSRAGKPASSAARQGVRAKGRPRRRTQVERSEETRDKLLTAAVKVLMRRGYLGFTTQETSKVAGVTRGAPLHHFRTSEAFLLAAIERLFAESRRQSEQTLQRIDPAASAEEILDIMVADARVFFFSNYFFAGIDALLSAKSGKVRAKVQELAYDFRSVVEGLWRDKFVACGFTLAAAEDIVWVTLSLVRGLAMRATFKQSAGRIDRSIELGVRLIKNHMHQTRQTSGSRPDAGA